MALPGGASGGNHPSFDLSGSQTFVAGPFTGTRGLDAARQDRVGAEEGRESVTSDPRPVVRPVPTRKVLIEQVTLRYRIASLPGTLDASFSGEPNPFCAALGSCGATGSLALSLPAVPAARCTLQASRTVPARVDARRGRWPTSDAGCCIC